jgi:hypothetical protein
MVVRPYGQWWLVIDDGQPVTRWTGSVEDVPPGEYVVMIRLGLYADEAEELARVFVDADDGRVWDYVADTLDDTAEPDVVSFAARYAEWPAVVQARVDRAAEEWLSWANTAVEDAPWGYSCVEGEIVPTAPPFRLEWA